MVSDDHSKISDQRMEGCACTALHMIMSASLAKFIGSECFSILHSQAWAQVCWQLEGSVVLVASAFQSGWEYSQAVSRIRLRVT
jgi:hypothetical protein